MSEGAEAGGECVEREDGAGELSREKEEESLSRT